jgi:hypothetical protein
LIHSDKNANVDTASGDIENQKEVFDIECEAGESSSGDDLTGVILNADNTFPSDDEDEEDESRKLLIGLE